MSRRTWLSLTCFIVAMFHGAANAHSKGAALRIDLRSSQHIFWYGQELSSPLFISAQGESVAINNLPDPGGPRGREQADQEQVVKLRGMPLVNRLEAQGLGCSAILAIVDSAITRTAERIVYAYHNAIRSHRDPETDTRQAADTTMVDLTRALVVRGEIVRMTIRGIGRAAISVEPATINALGAPHGARRSAAVIEPPSDRIERLKSILSRHGVQLVIVSQAGYTILSGDDAIRGLAEIDSVRTLNIPPASLRGAIVPRVALEQMIASSRGEH